MAVVIRPIIPLRLLVPATSVVEWQQRGNDFAAVRRHNAMAFGAWWNEGKRWDRARVAFVSSEDWDGPDLGTLREYARVHNKFKLSSALDSFPLRHLQAVTTLPLAEAEELLAEGRRKGWKSYDLRFAVARLKSGQVADHQPGLTLKQMIERGLKFRTLYADAPWRPDNATVRRSIERHYKTMSLDELCALPIKQLRHRDAHLHLWCPMFCLRQTFHLMEAWGFEYQDSGVVWCKQGRLGGGNNWRQCHELLLLGFAPEAKRFENHKLPSWVLAPRTNIHSEKPAVFRALVERVSPGPRLELFGRHDVAGWQVLGNQMITIGPP